MFWAIAAILFVLWVLGVISGAAVGTWVHLLLLFALISVVAAVISTRRVPAP